MIDLSPQETAPQLYLDDFPFGTPEMVQIHMVFQKPESQLNGLITNDKFCMSRTARLQLSWWRLPRSVRQANSEGVQYPVEENIREHLPQQEIYEKTRMESSAQLRGTA